MNFKLSFLCILFVNLLPQSFASPQNLKSRSAGMYGKLLGDERGSKLHEPVHVVKAVDRDD